VERLGGRIEVQSELNVGSTFSFALPIIQDAPD
jgi:signal transduction histidine kinase